MMTLLFKVMRSCGLLLITGVLITGTSVYRADPATAQELEKVRIGVGTRVLNITYPWLMMPQALGYWKEEGYDVEVFPISGSLAVVQQLIGGGIDVGQANSSVVIQGNTDKNLPLRVLTTNATIGWSLSVKKDSSIKKISDFKGKKIGVFSLASGGIPLLKSYLKQNGIDPEKDIQLISVGAGAPPVLALRRDRVDALMFWASANVGFENAGLSLRYFFDPAWRTYPDFSLITLQGTVDKKRDMLEAIARGAAKASVFAAANPDCVRKVHWKNWPDTKPRGSKDETTLIKWDLKLLDAQLEVMNAARSLNNGEAWGGASADGYSRYQNFLKNSGLIKQLIPAEQFLINDPEFYKRVNDFDHAAIKVAAKACKFD
jgi:NitT/TauT family transport system substrate-binding protein